MTSLKAAHYELQIRAQTLCWKNSLHLPCLCLQCVAESVLHIEEIDTEVVTK